MKILLIEDNRVLAKAINRVLKHEGFAVGICHTGTEGESFWRDHHADIDMVILDVMLPEKDGFAVCESMRSLGIATPVLMLTAKGEVDEKVRGLNVGADDYLVKPFAFEELLARIGSLLRRPKQVAQAVVDLSEGVTIDLVAHIVTKDGDEVSLTLKEFSILEFMIMHKNQVLTQQQIFDHVFDFAKENGSNTIEVHLKNIRKKIFPHSDVSPLKTVRGVGYRLEI